MKRLHLKQWVFIMLITLSVLPCYSQENRCATIIGIVNDKIGNPIIGATLVVYDKNHKYISAGISQELGLVCIKVPTADKYIIEIKASGLEKARIQVQCIECNEITEITAYLAKADDRKVIPWSGGGRGHVRDELPYDYGILSYVQHYGEKECPI